MPGDFHADFHTLAGYCSGGQASFSKAPVVLSSRGPRSAAFLARPAHRLLVWPTAPVGGVLVNGKDKVTQLASNEPSLTRAGTDEMC